MNRWGFPNNPASSVRPSGGLGPVPEEDVESVLNPGPVPRRNASIRGGEENADWRTGRGARLETARSDDGVNGQAVGEDQRTGFNDRDLIRELMAQNAQLNRFIMEQTHRAEQNQATVVNALNTFTRQVGGLPAALNPGGRLPREGLEQISEFRGLTNEDAADWVTELEDIGRLFGWTPEEQRRAALTKLQGNARDWQGTAGTRYANWADWRVGFLAAFGQVLTTEEWVQRMRSRVRRPEESVKAYSYSKMRICTKNPVAMTEPEMIKWLVVGIDDQVYKSSILAARPQTMDAYFQVLEELESIDRIERLCGSINISCNPTASASTSFGVGSGFPALSPAGNPGPSFSQTVNSLPSFSLAANPGPAQSSTVNSSFHGAARSAPSFSRPFPSAQGNPSFSIVPPSGQSTPIPGPVPGRAEGGPPRAAQRAGPAHGNAANPPRPAPFSSATWTASGVCFGCGKEGHFRYNCPELARPAPGPSGNE